jgi:hypothetical protein
MIELLEEKKGRGSKPLSSKEQKELSMLRQDY